MKPVPYYQDEYVTLYCGDCAEILPHLSVFFDALITDPPFGINFEYAKGKEQHKSADEYYKWLVPIIELCQKQLNDGAFNAIWQAQLYFQHFWNVFGSDIRIYCAAKNFVQLRKTPINYGYDPVVMFYKQGERKSPIKPQRNVDFFVSNTASIVSDTSRIERNHPCPRPLDVVTEIMNNFSLGTVLDPFAGSGTTLLAAKNLNRKAIGIEQEEEYCKVIVERLRQGVLGL